jgi:polysaccharide export outer membrane protein
MKHPFGNGIIALFLMSITLFTSCRSNKDLTYLRDTNSSEKHSGPRASQEYRIQPNDNLYVSVISPNSDMNELYNPATVGNQRTINNVWQNEPGQLVQGYLVENDGNVTLPSIGKIKISGLTMKEAEAKIESKAKEYLKEVTAKVRLLNYKITIMGEVNNPGVYYNYNYEYTIFDALSQAQGTKNSAKLERVLVLRQTPEGSQSFILNLNSKSALTSPAYFLEPNDVVVIQPSKYKNVELRLPLYTAALSTVTTLFLVLNFVANNQ